MCFYSNTTETKIANKPIKVCKFLKDNDMAPTILYKYVRGLNTPEYPEDSCTYNKYDNYYIYMGGWLHAFKYFRRKNHESLLRYGLHSVVMFIPKGCKYHDAGIAPKYLQDCTDHIISKALYWPKNWFDYIRWYIKSIF